MKISLKNGNFIQSITIIFIYILGLIVVPLVVRDLFGIYDKNLLIYINLIINFLTVIFLVYFSNKLNVNNIESNSISLWKSIGIGILGFIFMIMVQIIVSLILFVLSKIYGFEHMSANTKFITSIIKQYPLFIIMPVFFAPVLEELVFRKAIFGYFYDILEGSNKVLKFIIAGSLTGILFALPHDGFSPQMIMYILMSLVFSFLYLSTKRIITPIIAHMLMNLLVVLIQVFQ